MVLSDTQTSVSIKTARRKHRQTILTMNYLHKNSAPCTKTEVDLFTVPPTQTAILDTQLISISPINSVSGLNSTPVEFVIPGSSEYFLDLSSVSLQLRVQLVKANGDQLPTTSEAFPESNFLHTYFNQVAISLNGKKVSSSSSNYAYRTYLEKFINYSVTSKMTHQNSSGYFSESLRDDHNTNCKNNKKKIFEYYGKLHGDIFQQNRLLLNSVEVRIKMVRSPHAFHINQSGPNTDDVIAKILDSELFVKRVKLSSHVYLSIERHLTAHNAMYPLRRVETRSYTIPSALTFKSINNIVNGTIPQKLIFGLLPHRAELGDYSKSCFHFNHFDLDTVSLCLNGAPVIKPYEVDFTSENKVLSRPYFDLFTTNGFIGSSSNGLTADEYTKTATLFSFDLSNDQCSNLFSHINPLRQGELSLKLKFKSPVVNPITVLIFMEYLDIVEISRSRTVLYDI